MEELHETFRRVYEYIYSKAINYDGFEFKPTEAQNKQIANFIEFLKKKVDINSIGLNWVYDFVLWGIRERVENDRTYKGKIPPNWVIGKKAYEVFEKKPKDYWAYFNHRFAKEKGILFSDLEESFSIECLDYYDSVRKQNYQQDMPIAYCWQIVPFERLSKYCIQCTDKTVCRKINS